MPRVRPLALLALWCGSAAAASVATRDGKALLAAANDCTDADAALVARAALLLSAHAKRPEFVAIDSCDALVRAKLCSAAFGGVVASHACPISCGLGCAQHRRSATSLLSSNNFFKEHGPQGIIPEAAPSSTSVTSASGHDSIGSTAANGSAPHGGEAPAAAQQQERQPPEAAPQHDSWAAAAIGAFLPGLLLTTPASHNATSPVAGATLAAAAEPTRKAAQDGAARVHQAADVRGVIVMGAVTSVGPQMPPAARAVSPSLQAAPPSL